MKKYIYQILVIISSIGILIGLWGTLNVISGYKIIQNSAIKHENFIDGAIAGFYKTYTLGNFNLAMSIGTMDLEAKEAAKEQLQIEGKYQLNLSGRILGNMIFMLIFTGIILIARKYKNT